MPPKGKIGDVAVMVFLIVSGGILIGIFLAGFALLVWLVTDPFLDPLGVPGDVFVSVLFAAGTTVAFCLIMGPAVWRRAILAVQHMKGRPWAKRESRRIFKEAEKEAEYHHE